MTLAVALLAAAALMALVALLPQRWFVQPPPPRPPLTVDALVPNGTMAIDLPKGARREADGMLTILAAPPGEIAAPPIHQRKRISKASAAPAIPPTVAGGIRLFATLRLAPASASEQLTVSDLVPGPLQISTIILRDGCFRLAEAGGPIVVFDIGARLFIDGQGYLSLTNGPGEAAMDARIGEPVSWAGERRAITDRRSLARIQARCGTGRAQLVGLVQSISVGQSEADDGAAKRLADMYGFSRDEALARARGCRKALSNGPGGSNIVMIANPCGSNPPPPVGDRRNCPPGTTLSFGLCRTAQGYIRPVPAFPTA